MSIPNVVFVDEDDAELILNINNLSEPKKTNISKSTMHPHCTVKFITGSLLDIGTFTFDLQTSSRIKKRKKKKRKKNNTFTLKIRIKYYILYAGMHNC